MIVRLSGLAHLVHGALYFLPFFVLLISLNPAPARSSIIHTALSEQKVLGVWGNGLSDIGQDESTINNLLIEEEALAPQPLAKGDGRATVIGNTPGGDVEYPGSWASMLDALNVMQSHFFELWQGTWPNAIDWTRAVMGTQVSATLIAITSYKDIGRGPASTRESPLALDNFAIRENLVNQYFGHVTSFYFGENAFDLRTQAYDDMLWVVLGWLESVEFINLHSKHYNSSRGETEAFSWHGRQFIPSFAHRARVFYDIASRGWDTSLCGGGMLWSPYLAPYKNAITNQLFIAASVSMYLYFPGDSNKSPFTIDRDGQIQPAKPHDRKYLQAAVDAYEWLSTSNMTNALGLYTDGFHIRGWQGRGPNGSIGTGECNVRDETVYTYNQGVLLSGLRGLWSSTGSSFYLEDGHTLIRNVITATGWPLATTTSPDRAKWAGIGRNGILEENCDSSGTCSQNGQTFKGIFFHHMTVFCTKLPVRNRDGKKEDDDGVAFKADQELAALHRKACESYKPWIAHNARAAYGTRDDKREFGMWWTPGLWREDTENQGGDSTDYEAPPPREGGSDYRNRGIPDDDVWRLPGHHHLPAADQTLTPIASSSSPLTTAQGREEAFFFRGSSRSGMEATFPMEMEMEKEKNKDKDKKSSSLITNMNMNMNWDPNTRGRGRTVETQSGGLAVLRALFQLVDMDRDGDADADGD